MQLILLQGGVSAPIKGYGNDNPSTEQHMSSMILHQASFMTNAIEKEAPPLFPRFQVNSFRKTLTFWTQDLRSISLSRVGCKVFACQ
ncbi:unnamed protein product [Brassica oleracea var. botrytis]